MEPKVSWLFSQEPTYTELSELFSHLGNLLGLKSDFRNCPSVYVFSHNFRCFFLFFHACYISHSKIADEGCKFWSFSLRYFHHFHFPFSCLGSDNFFICKVKLREIYLHALTMYDAMNRYFCWIEHYAMKTYGGVVHGKLGSLGWGNFQPVLRYKGALRNFTKGLRAEGSGTQFCNLPTRTQACQKSWEGVKPYRHSLIAVYPLHYLQQ
jgi:hypothetical protein